MVKVAQEKNTAQEKSACSRAVRDLPLERFRLPRDGRKWKSIARYRAAVLEHISHWANGDGSFVRDVKGAPKPINYSPSEKRLTRRFAKATLYRRTKELWILDLLDWERPTRQSRRIYTINATAPYPFLPRETDVSDSDEKDVSNSKLEVSDSGEDVSDSAEGRLTSETVPSLPSLPSNTREDAANPAAFIPPVPKGNGNTFPPGQIARWAIEAIEWCRTHPGRSADEYIRAKREGRDPDDNNPPH
jgi:hypothetical protein